MRSRVYFYTESGEELNDHPCNGAPCTGTSTDKISGEWETTEINIAWSPADREIVTTEEFEQDRVQAKVWHPGAGPGGRDVRWYTLQPKP